jgi:hypothetical protein
MEQLRVPSWLFWNPPYPGSRFKLESLDSPMCRSCVKTEVYGDFVDIISEKRKEPETG